MGDPDRGQAEPAPRRVTSYPGMSAYISRMPDSPPRPFKRSFLSRVMGLLVFLLAVGALAAAGYLYRRLEQERAERVALAGELTALGGKLDQRFEQFKAAVRDVDRQLTATVFQEIDLSTAGWQPIAGGFYVIDLALAPAAKGTRITGKVINPTSVTHEAATFSVRIGVERAQFEIAKMPPGVAQSFEVALPNVAPIAAKKAFFALSGSTISFASSTTRKRAGTEPVDTDKLLK